MKNAEATPLAHVLRGPGNSSCPWGSTQLLMFVGFLAALVFCPYGHSQDETDLGTLRTRAIRNSVQKVRNSLLQITVFSDEGNAVRLGTGVFVSRDGEFITSTYFANRKKDQIIANIDGVQKTAQWIGVDRSRNIALLKLPGIANREPLFFKKNNSPVGSTAIAIGKVFSTVEPNLSVGIVSARNRLAGRAIQTDAKISPSNYGGPLLDLRGQPLGLLTVLNITDRQETDSHDWYDSGIGFAIPAESVATSIEKIRRANGDVYSGKIGIQFETMNSNRGIPVVANCFPRSPAAVAGIRPNDRIVKVNEQPVSNLNQFRQMVGPLYANDKISLTIERAKTQSSLTLTLADKLSLYKFPYLGLIANYNRNEDRLLIESIDKSGPATGKIQPGDAILTLNGTEISSPGELRTSLSQLEAGDSVQIQVLRDAKKLAIQIQVSNILQPVSAKSFGGVAVPTAKDLRRTPIKVNGYSNRCELISPVQVEKATVGNKMIVILAKSTSEKSKDIDRWDQLAISGSLSVLKVFPNSMKGWHNSELEFLGLLLRQVERQFPNVESSILVSNEQAFTIGNRLLLANRNRFRGFVAVAPEVENMDVLPFSNPGNSLFVLAVPSRTSMSACLSLCEQLKQNGISSELLPSSKESRKSLMEQIAIWIRLCERI